MNSFSTVPAISISLLSIICVVLTLTGFHDGLKRSELSPARRRRAMAAFAGGIVLWISLAGVLASRGFFSNFAVLPPRLLIALLVPGVVLLIALITSQGLRQAVNNIPFAWLFYVQVFRVAVELILWRGFKLGLVPIQMTFEGRNFDILAGLTAPIAGWIWQRSRNRAFAIGWNLAGLCLLLNIVVVAILSMPTPLRVFKDAPANTLLTQFPFIYLPAILVPLAYTAHILSLRQLWSMPRRSAN